MTNAEIVDLRSGRFDEDKYGYIEELRAQSFNAPIAGGYVFFNQDDATYIMRGTDFRFSFFQIDDGASPYLARAIEHELLNMHGEQHTRIRKLVSAALRDRVVDDLREQIAQVADDLIDAMPQRGVVDLVQDFCEPLPSRILGPMYGIPYDDTEGLNDWIKVGGRKVDALQSGDGVEEVEAANRKIHTYLRDLLSARRQNLGGDIFSELIGAEVDGDRLSEDELVYLAGELASAGVDTTRAQLPLAIFELLRHPAQLELLLADPELAMSAIDEGMRFAPLPWALPHTALRDVTYKGIEIKKGELAMVLVPAANRDPEMVERPAVFDITRARARNFSFGHGMHACPAAQLARVEMSIALKQLTSRIGSMRLTEQPDLEPVQKGHSPVALFVEIEKR